MTITEQDFDGIVESYWTGGHFGAGFDVLGYIGNSARNYVTDVWVRESANELGWLLTDLSEWMTGVGGRFALDAAPMSQAEMREQMAATAAPFGAEQDEAACAHDGVEIPSLVKCGRDGCEALISSTLPPGKKSFFFVEGEAAVVCLEHGVKASR